MLPCTAPAHPRACAGLGPPSNAAVRLNPVSLRRSPCHNTLSSPLIPPQSALSCGLPLWACPLACRASMCCRSSSVVWASTWSRVRPRVVQVCHTAWAVHGSVYCKSSHLLHCTNTCAVRHYRPRCGGPSSLQRPAPWVGVCRGARGCPWCARSQLVGCGGPCCGAHLGRATFALVRPGSCRGGL